MTGAQPASPPMRRALIWGAVNFGVTQAGAFVVFLVLARTLPPHVFGVFAFALVFVEFFADQGRFALVDAAILRRDFTNRGMSGAMFVGMAVAALGFLLSLVAAPLLAGLVGMPQLAIVMPALAALMLFTPAQAAMEAKLAAELKLRSIAIRNMCVSLFGGAAGLAVAFGPHPEWALVAQRAAQIIAAIAALWAATRFRPTRDVDWPSAWALTRNAGGIWRNQVLGFMPQRLMEYLVGARMGAAPLGQLQVFTRLLDIVRGPLQGSLLGLFSPILSRSQGDVASIRTSVLHMTQGLALLCVPAFAGLALVAPQFVAVFLGPDFAPHAGVLAAICIGSLLMPIQGPRTNVFAALQRNGVVTRLNLLDVCVVAVAVSFALPHGLEAVARTLAASMLLTGVITFFAECRALGHAPQAYAAQLGPPYLATAVMLAGGLLTREATAGLPDLARLAITAPVGAAIYAGWLALFHRKWALSVLSHFRGG